MKPFISMAMESKKNTATPNKLRNLLKVLVKTRVLVKLFISMAMESKKNIAMLKLMLKMNLLKVLVKTRVLVKLFISMAMVNKKNIAMLKQKTNRFTKMMIFS